MPDGRNEYTQATVIRSGPTQGRNEYTQASVIRSKYPDGLIEYVQVSVIRSLPLKVIRRGVFIADG
jgi:hypothetical protein